MGNKAYFANARELGGYHNIQGKKIKPHCLYRSGNLLGMNKKEKELFDTLEIEHIVDFRSNEEVSVHPYPIPNGCKYVHESALHTKEGLENFYFFMLINETSTYEDILNASRFVREGYKELPFHNKAFKKVFDLMLTSERGILFHCSSGKDRTGVMAALILKMLDVDEKIIMDDYLESNRNILKGTLRHAEELGFSGKKKETLIYCCSVHKELLSSSFKEILKKYTTWSSYFKQEYDLDETKIKFLKSKYLIDE